LRGKARDSSTLSSPSPTLPRKRGREQTELAARSHISLF
jgi:hypothetical protein